jgi:hypothetical protein
MPGFAAARFLGRAKREERGHKVPPRFHHAIKPHFCRLKKRSQFRKDSQGGVLAVTETITSLCFNNIELVSSASVHSTTHLFILVRRPAPSLSQAQALAARHRVGQ